MDEELRARVGLEGSPDLRGADARVHVALPHPDVHLAAGDLLDVGPQEHVGEEEDLPVLGDRLHHRHRVGRGAADVRLRLDLGRGVHVGDHDRVRMLRLPRSEPLSVDRRGERAAGLQIGDEDGLLGREDLRGLRHEVDAAEHDGGRVRLRGSSRQLQGIAHEVGGVLDPGHLVVVGQHHGPAARREAPNLVGERLERAQGLISSGDLVADRAHRRAHDTRGTREPPVRRGS